MDQAWDEDELCLDPTRVTLSIGGTGIDGDTFKKRLIEQYDIQINKTSRNTVLFLTHIGTTRGSVAYLIEVLIDMASKLDDTLEHESGIEQRMREGAINSLTVELPPLPNFSRFHDAFRSPGQTGEGDLRRAYFLAGEEPLCEYLKLDGTVERAIANGREVVTAAFIIPYPPGFPVLVPGQVVSKEILTYIKALDVKEIHGYYPEYGVRVFTDAALAEAAQRRGAQSGSQS
jgi:arginine decarboxylase